MTTTRRRPGRPPRGAPVADRDAIVADALLAGSPVAALAGGLPVTTAGMTIDRQCASGMMAMLKKLKPKTKKTSAGEGQMKILRRLPKILKFIPGKAQDLRAYFLTLQYWLASSEENVLRMVRFLVDRYADVLVLQSGCQGSDRMRDFLLELGEQYLFVALHAMLCESLLAESERRVRHLDGAVRHLEEQLATLQRRVQTLRQEEIIEEIEVILLNAASLDTPLDRPASSEPD